MIIHTQYIHKLIINLFKYLFPGRFAERPELGDLNLFGEFSPPLPRKDWYHWGIIHWGYCLFIERILNEQSIGEILIGFFQYYSRFDFVKDAISIRKGMTFPRLILSFNRIKQLCSVVDLNWVKIQWSSLYISRSHSTAKILRGQTEGGLIIDFLTQIFNWSYMPLLST